MRISWKKLWLALLFSTPLHAEEQTPLWQSPRTVGRGGTYVAAYDSDESGFLNPAAINDAKVKYQLRLLQVDAFVGQNSLDTVSELTSLSSSKDGFEVLKKFDDKFGKTQFIRLQGSLLAQRFGHFEFAPFVYNATSLKIGTPATLSMQWKSDTAAGAHLAYAFPLSQTVSLGMAIRPYYRWFIKGGIDFVDLLDFIPPSETKFEDYSPLVSGFALGSDLGLIYSPTKDFRLGLLAQHLGDSGYVQKTGTQPPRMEQVISTGILSRSHLGRFFDLDLSFDMQDLTNRQGLNLLRLCHFGAELGASPISRDHDWGILVGLNEGYLSKGIFMDFLLMRFDLVSYTVEQGVTPGQNPDQRWAATMRSSLTF